MAKAATATKPTTTRKGLGNTAAQPTTGAPVTAPMLAGVVATPTAPAPAPTATGRPRNTAASLAATMAAKQAAKPAAKPATARKVATAAPAAKPAPAASGSAAVAARKATTAARNAATAQVCLDFLTAHAGTAYDVKEVEIGTGNGPTSGNIKTLRPALWALARAGKVVGPDTGLTTSKGRKGFMVPKAAARKATAKPASK